MDFKTMLNDESVEPTVRRFSSSHDGGSVRNDSIPGPESSVLPPSSRKRSRSPSQSQAAQSSPTPKRIKPKRQRPKEPPIWARKWTPQWADENRRRNNEHVAAQIATPTAAPTPIQASAPARQPPQQQHSQLPQRPASSHLSSSGREPSYVNAEPLDDVTESIAAFIHREVVETGLIFDPPPNTVIEIEAKIGTIVNRDGQRYQLPVLAEAPLSRMGENCVFRSSMTTEEHRRMNDHLNKAVRDSHGKGRTKIAFKHLREIDTFWQAPNSVLRESLSPEARRRIHGTRPRVRLTHENDKKVINANGGKRDLKAAIIKVRWADMHVVSPRTQFDWRISISLEMQYPGDTTTLEPAQDAGPTSGGREKDRMSYEHQGINIDLTQVTMDDGKEHELEFELQSNILKEEAERVRQGQQEGFRALVSNFVNDVRTATRLFQTPG